MLLLKLYVEYAVQLVTSYWMQQFTCLTVNRRTTLLACSKGQRHLNQHLANAYIQKCCNTLYYTYNNYSLDVYQFDCFTKGYWIGVNPG